MTGADGGAVVVARAVGMAPAAAATDTVSAGSGGLGSV
jgi:hypothetical protein